MSQKKPFAVLLCKFKDDARGWVTVNKTNVAAMFTATDLENVVTFWRDMSYGEVDLSGSGVFGWLTLDQNQADYKGSGANPSGRHDLVNWAKKAASDSGYDLSSFYGVIVYTSTGTDLWGSSGEVVCHLQSSLSEILQEVGHGLGLAQHSRAVANPTDYENPYCIMSGMTFGSDIVSPSPVFSTRFGSSGPGLCSPFIHKLGWLSESRVVHVPTNGKHPATTQLRLSPLGDRSPAYSQVAMFGFNDPFDALTLWNFVPEHGTGACCRMRLLFISFVRTGMPTMPAASQHRLLIFLTK